MTEHTAENDRGKWWIGNADTDPLDSEPTAENGLREEIARRLYVNQAQQGEHFGTEGPWWDDADAVLDILERRKTRVFPPGKQES